MIGSSSILPKTILLAGLAMWISIAVLNNMTDMATNIFHLNNMFTMSLLKNQDMFAQGLKWRAIPVGIAPTALYIIIAVQLIVSSALWVAAWKYLQILMSKSSTVGHTDRASANLALSLFGGLWLTFLCGGLWFGYWMKQGAIQNVHFTLLLVTICSLIFINLPEQIPEK